MSPEWRRSTDRHVDEIGHAHQPAVRCEEVERAPREHGDERPDGEHPGNPGDHAPPSENRTAQAGQPFELGSLKIYAFGTFIVLAFLVASFFVRRRAMQSLDLDGERVFNICFALLFIGLLGARLLYVLVHYEDHVKTPMSAFAIWKGGLVFYGGLILGILWLAWYLPRHADLKGWALVDVMAIAMGLAIFVGRWASFLSGENYGKPAEGLPWAVKFPPGPETQVPSSLRGVDLHPTQLYHSLHGLVLFVILFLIARRSPQPGRVTGLFLMLYAVGRFVIEFWRGDDEQRGMVIDGILSTSQLISIPIFFVGLAIFLIRRAPDPETAGT